MATVTASYQPAPGRQYVDLTSWAGDAVFSSTPVSGDQIEASNALTVGADGATAGANGTYTLRHVAASTGMVEAISYTVNIADVTAPVLSGLVAVGNNFAMSISATVATDEGNGTLFAFASENATENAATVEASAQASETVSATGSQSVSVSGLPTGTYYLHVVHKDLAGNVSNVLSSVAITLAESARVNKTYSAGSNRTVVTLVAPVDPYIFQEWTEAPDPGEQLVTQTSAGTFDENGNFSTDVEAIVPAYHVALDGTVTRFIIDTTGLDGAVDITPDDFQFVALTDQARSIQVVSNAITVAGVDAVADIPVSIEGGEYSVSTDGGNTWGGWTSSDSDVRLNYQIRVRHTTSDEYSSGGYDGVRTTSLNVGGRVRTFQSTTLADTVAPVISLIGGNVTLTQGDPWVEPGYTAIDNADGDISVSGVTITGTIDTNTLGQQSLVYTATDRSGNTSSTTRFVTIVEDTPDDTIKPVITLAGGNQQLYVGETWEEPGFTARDNVDGDITEQVVVTGTVDTSRPNTVTLTYTVTDSSGNVGVASRIVTVLSAVDYPMDIEAPEQRTYLANRFARFDSSEPFFIMQSGEVLDYDFDLSEWLDSQGDDLVSGSHDVVELAQALDVEAVGIVTGNQRVKVWLKADTVTDSQSSLVQLKVSTTRSRTAVFQFRVLIINRMQ